MVHVEVVSLNGSFEGKRHTDTRVVAVPHWNKWGIRQTHDSCRCSSCSLMRQWRPRVAVSLIACLAWSFTTSAVRPASGRRGFFHHLFPAGVALWILLQPLIVPSTARPVLGSAPLCKNHQKGLVPLYCWQPVTFRWSVLTTYSLCLLWKACENGLGFPVQIHTNYSDLDWSGLNLLS